MSVLPAGSLGVGTHSQMKRGEATEHGDGSRRSVTLGTSERKDESTGSQGGTTRSWNTRVDLIFLIGVKG